MKASNDESYYDNRCDELMSQGRLGVGVVNQVDEASVVTDIQPINNEQRTETKSRKQTTRHLQ